MRGVAPEGSSAAPQERQYLSPSTASVPQRPQCTRGSLEDPPGFPLAASVPSVNRRQRPAPTLIPLVGCVLALAWVLSACERPGQDHCSASSATGDCHDGAAPAPAPAAPAPSSTAQPAPDPAAPGAGDPAQPVASDPADPGASDPGERPDGRRKRGDGERRELRRPQPTRFRRNRRSPMPKSTAEGRLPRLPEQERVPRAGEAVTNAPSEPTVVQDDECPPGSSREQCKQAGEELKNQGKGSQPAEQSGCRPPSAKPTAAASVRRSRSIALGASRARVARPGRVTHVTLECFASPSILGTPRRRFRCGTCADRSDGRHRGNRAHRASHPGDRVRHLHPTSRSS